MTTTDTRSAIASTGYRLRLPGPTEVPERVRQAMARVMVNHRGPECRTAIGEAEEMIRPILGTTNHVLFFASSGPASWRPRSSTWPDRAAGSS